MKNHSNSQKTIKLLFWILWVMMLIMLLIVLKPMWWDVMKLAKSNGSDLIFLLDVSKSMNVYDVNYNWEKISRLQASKALIKNILKQYPNDRAALVVFAKESVWICPLTLDREIFLTFLEWVDDKNVTDQGTDIPTALQDTIKRFSNDDKRWKAIIVISDGWDENLSIKWKIDESSIKNIKFLGIGVWTKLWAAIIDWLDVFGNPIYKSFQGKTVYSKLNEQYFSELINDLKWTYFTFDSITQIKKIDNILSWLKKSELINLPKTQKSDLTRYFIMIFGALLMLYLMIRYWNLFNKLWSRWRK